MKNWMKKMYAMSKVLPVMALALLVTNVAEQMVSTSSCLIIFGEPDAPAHLLKK